MTVNVYEMAGYSVLYVFSIRYNNITVDYGLEITGIPPGGFPAVIRYSV